ncbi:hypothetical protein L1987_84734 [Smallanthus sonchifolius]|uniref:Uncharacterized protein n=1 Tax=Smallanthus sonchifolius TaxID=185202 RepID=A0ACB8XV07_9ASTR|nr:hypothetical protein L1987_84734 [Smallanthus sonchifolius]
MFLMNRSRLSSCIRFIILNKQCILTITKSKGKAYCLIGQHQCTIPTNPWSTKFMPTEQWRANILEYRYRPTFLVMGRVNPREDGDGGAL